MSWVRGFGENGSRIDWRDESESVKSKNLDLGGKLAR